MYYIGSISLHELFTHILKVRPFILDRVVSYRTYTSSGINLLSQLLTRWYHMVDQIRVLDRILVHRRQKANRIVPLKDFLVSLENVL
jgi:hypothetical protein